MQYNWDFWEQLLLDKIKRPLTAVESIGYCPSTNEICITVECGAEPSHSHIKLDNVQFQTRLFSI